MRRFVPLCVVLAATSVVSAQSAWLPEPGRFVFNTSVVHQRFDEFYRGTERNPTPFGDLQQTTVFVGVERAISPRLAVDGLIGYASTSGTSASGLGEEGLADSHIGLRWQAIDERPGVPTVTLRVGAIVEGTYDVGTPAAPGDGASGATGSVLVGKFYQGSRIGLQGDVGYRAMFESVPNAIVGSFVAFKSLSRHTISAGYRYDGCVSGIDIGSPGFTPARFPETREIFHAVELGWSYARGARGAWGLTLAQTIDGRNTDRKTVFVASLSY